MHSFHFRFDAMGSGCEVVIVAETKKDAQSIAGCAIEEVSRIERKFSRYRSDSIVSLINAAAGLDWVECDEETLSLFQYADTLFESSAGLFDITAGVLRHAWDFGSAVVPDNGVLTRQCSLINWQSVERQGNSVRMPLAGMELDFGGFGKEYAADRAAALIHGKGVRNGYVNLAGDIRVVGPKPDKSPWLIGIQDPRHKSRTIASIPLFTGALATSGDYERFFEVDGHRYCHIIHPRSGYPVTYWRSVTVIAPLAITAGSYSTIAMLKGADGLAFLENSGMRYLAVDQLGEMFYKNR